jgi:hypothetical protein
MSATEIAAIELFQPSESEMQGLATLERKGLERVLPPERMETNTLAELVTAKLEELAVFSEQLKPYYLELRARFRKKTKSERIYDCKTWEQFCATVLKRTKRAVNYFLAGGNPVIKRRSGGKPFPNESAPEPTRQDAEEAQATGNDDTEDAPSSPEPTDNAVSEAEELEPVRISFFKSENDGFYSAKKIAGLLDLGELTKDCSIYISIDVPAAKLEVVREYLKQHHLGKFKEEREGQTLKFEVEP